MPFSDRLTDFRKLRGLTQGGLAELIGITKTQIYRYEKGNAQPTLDVIKRLSIALSVTSDQLIFEDDERAPPNDLLMQFEALTQFSSEEKMVAKEILDSLILKHTANRFSARTGG